MNIIELTFFIIYVYNKLLNIANLTQVPTACKKFCVTNECNVGSPLECSQVENILPYKNTRVWSMV